jgi:hypothetical protein
MSDRELSAIRALHLSLIFTIVMSVGAGCERTGTVSRPAAEAPLLLEDVSFDGAQSDSGADNGRCFVCHMNYVQEKIAVTHAKVDIGCAQCHGPSDAHIADESWASGGNGTAPDIIYPRDKINPSCMACHAREEIDTPRHQAVLANPPGTKVCTDCHGSHRLPQRRCKWK